MRFALYVSSCFMLLCSRMDFLELKKISPEVWRLIKAEAKRQNETLALIPSENYQSAAVREAEATILSAKYSEGYPGKRYYPGNAVVDEIERLCQAEALKVFGLSPAKWHANVQPLSGSPANTAVYFALLEFGDTLMGLKLSHGGHITHGLPVSFSGRAYHAVHFEVDPATGRLDYEKIAALAQKEKPQIIIAGFTAYPPRVDFERFGKIAQSAGAYLLADISHIAGLVAAGVHPSPFPYADVVMTTTHKTLRGPRGAVIFCRRALAERIDKAVFPGLQGGPHNHMTAAKAVAFQEARTPQFKAYQRQIVVNAALLAEELKQRGATLVSGGTETHLILMDVRPLGLDGSMAEQRLEAAGIIANRNTVPGDPSPFKPSGIRIGTPALTTRGLKNEHMAQLADWLMTAVTKPGEGLRIAKEVKALLKKFPIP